MSGAQPPAATHCLNCGAAIAGHYCAHCGQPADVHLLSSKELLHEALEGITHSDSRLWRTLSTLWFRPGELTLEFVRGRRTAYLPPFRLYLVVSVIFFLLASHSESGLKFMSAGDLQASHLDTSKAKDLSEADCAEFRFFGDPASAWNQRLKRGCLTAAQDSGRSWRHQALSLLPKAMFVFVPLVAFLHMLLYWRPRHRYAEHLLFFLHLHAFFFSVAILFALLEHLEALPALATLAAGLSTLLNVALLLYTAIALKRVFQQGWILTLLKGIALLFLYSVLLAVTISAVFLYSALQL